MSSQMKYYVTGKINKVQIYWIQSQVWIVQSVISS